MPHPPQPEDFYSVARKLITQASERVRQDRDRRGTSNLPETFTKLEHWLDKRSNWQILDDELATAIDEVRRIQQLLETLRRDLDDEHLRDVLLGDQFASLIQEGSNALVVSSTDHAHSWVRAYALCLSEWQLEKCMQIASLSNVSKSDGISELLAKAADHLSKSEISANEAKQSVCEIDEALQYLASKGWGDGQVDTVCRANLLVLHGRLQLYHLSQSDVARYTFGEAIAVKPGHELPAAALGEYYLSRSDFDAAKQQFEKAIQLPPELIDGYLGVARLYEAQDSWQESGKWYDRAADVALKDRNPFQAMRKLLAPATGNAYLHLAFKLARDRSVAALEATEHAIKLGIQGKGGYPEAEALRLKADILANLGRKEEAETAFSEAGKSFSWRNTPEDTEEARRCFETATQLNSTKASNFWRLADVYLNLSYGASDEQTKRAHVERGIEVWNAATQSLPKQSFSWAYSTRAGLAFQKADLLRGDDWPKRINFLWQTTAMMERLLLITEGSANDWSNLGLAFDVLNLHQNALNATEKAFVFDSDALLVAERRIFALANAGHYEEAIEKIEHRLKLRDDTWVYSYLALVKLQQECYREAKESIERAYAGMEGETLSVWELNLRARIYALTNDLDRAKEDWEIIYVRRDENDIQNLWIYANAAFELGKIDEAIQLLQTPILLRDPIEHSSVLISLGLFRLCSGQADQGWKNIEEGILHSRDVWVIDFYRSEFKEQLSAQDADRAMSLLRAKLKALKQPKTCERELIEAHGTFGGNENEKSWVRVGIQASLARIYREQGRWLEAAKLYKQLLALGPIPSDDMPPFPEARRGLELCFDLIDQLGDEAFKANNADEAIQHYKNALQLDEDSLRDEITKESTARGAAQHAKLALALLDMQSVDAARNQLTTALKLYRQIDEPNYVQRLADVFKPMLRDRAHYWRTHNALNSMIAHQHKPETPYEDILALVEMMSSYLDKRHPRDFKQFGSSVRAIILEFGARVMTAIGRTTSLLSKLLRKN